MSIKVGLELELGLDKVTGELNNALAIVHCAIKLITSAYAQLKLSFVTYIIRQVKATKLSATAMKICILRRHKGFN